MLSYDSIASLVEAAEKEGKKISEVVLADQAADMGLSEEEVFAKMDHDVDVMIEAVQFGKRKDQKSTSGLTGGEGYKMDVYSTETKGGLSGNIVSRAMMRALSVSGCNASMGRIVATPTAGSCGIMPGCLLTLMEDKGMDRKDVVMSMFTAAAFGMVIAKNACIAGAQGLVCDPVAGLVEIPCVKRNAGGVVIAFSSADIALAGIGSCIPVDECIIAMRNVGNALPASLRETAGGGLAATPTGRRMKEQVFGKDKE